MELSKFIHGKATRIRVDLPYYT